MRPAWRYAASASQWVTGVWLLGRLRVPGPSPAGRRGRRRVTVLVPARDESAALPHLLMSLRAQTTAAEEVIVIDDASTDGTAALARAAGATVLAVAGPPAGWSGKCWALHHGQAAATGELLVFLDADVTLAPDGLERMIAEHDRLGGAGIVSAEPYHRAVRRYEQLSAVANVVALMGTGAFVCPRPAEPRPMAFGACLIIDRATYDRVGGHAHRGVRSKITEDLALAQLAHRAGVPVGVFAGGDAVSFRMYPGGVRQLVDGWTKVLATGARGGAPWITAAVGWWIAGATVAAMSGARAGAALLPMPAFRRQTPSPPGGELGLAGDAATYVLWAAQMGWQFRRAGRFAPLTAAAFPVPLVTFLVCFARSVAKIGLGRDLAWRGRTLTGR